MHRLAAFAAALALVLVPTATAAGTVGTSFPAGFPTISDASLGTPVLGFGAAGAVDRTPVIFLHGNNDTPFPNACNPFGYIHNVAQYFLDNGYNASELWGLGYQGDQCDLATTPTNRSGPAHSTVANVPDLDRFVRAVLAYTGAKRVDFVGHSLGGTLVRAWVDANPSMKHVVRRLVTIASPSHGIIDCGPLASGNYFALDALGGFTPDSAICTEYGATSTPFLDRLNRGNETRGLRVLALGNTDRDFVYISAQDGPFFPPIPSIDRNGAPADFSASPFLEGATNVGLTDQGLYDPILGTAHLGIANSPETKELALAFLSQT